jgi:hypothetical protein
MRKMIDPYIEGASVKEALKQLDSYFSINMHQHNSILCTSNNF